MGTESWHGGGLKMQHIGRGSDRGGTMRRREREVLPGMGLLWLCSVTGKSRDGL